MAAPQTAYQSQALKLKLGTATPLNIFIAKFLQNTTPTTGDTLGDGYFNSADNDSVRKDKILDIFKLDDFVTIQHSTVGKSFVGFINPSGDNAPYHNSTRHSRGRVGKGTIGHILLNDAGLNTKGDITGVTVKSYLIGGGIKLTALYKSSFYNITIDHGIHCKILPSEDQFKRSFYESPIEPKAKVQKTSFIVANLDAEKLIAGNYMEITPYITNGEGEFQFPKVTIQINPYVIWMKYAEDTEFTSLESAANALRLRGMPADDSIGTIGFSTFYRNPALYTEGRVRAYKPTKTPTEIAEAGREYLMSDMSDSSNGLIGYFQDSQTEDSNGDLSAETYRISLYNGLPYITEYMSFKFLIPAYQTYQGQFQTTDQFSDTYSATATYDILDIKSDVSEWMKSGFNTNEWDNPNYTYSLTANTNDYLKRYLDGGVTKYLWYIAYASVIATGFIVLPISGDTVNYAWKFYQDGKLKFEGTLPFPGNW